VEILGDRLRVFGDVIAQGRAFFVATEALEYDEKAFDKRVRAPGAAERLGDYRGWLAAQTAFDAGALESGTAAWLAERGLGLGDIVHAVRVATTGSASGPSFFDCLAVLGKEACLARIDRALARLP
jgi:glutamyl-tRNA synthetase